MATILNDTVISHSPVCSAKSLHFCIALSPTHREIIAFEFVAELMDHNVQCGVLLVVLQKVLGNMLCLGDMSGGVSRFRTISVKENRA